MTTIVKVGEAKTNLSQLIDKAASGEDVILSRNGKPLVRKKEKNYFFRLSKYSDALLRLLAERPEFVPQLERRVTALLGVSSMERKVSTLERLMLD